LRERKFTCLLTYLLTARYEARKLSKCAQHSNPGRAPATSVSPALPLAHDAGLLITARFTHGESVCFIRI